MNKRSFHFFATLKVEEAMIFVERGMEKGEGRGKRAEEIKGGKEDRRRDERRGENGKREDKEKTRTARLRTSFFLNNLFRIVSLFPICLFVSFLSPSLSSLPTEPFPTNLSSTRYSLLTMFHPLVLILP